MKMQISLLNSAIRADIENVSRLKQLLANAEGTLRSHQAAKIRIIDDTWLYAADEGIKLNPVSTKQLWTKINRGNCLDLNICIGDKVKVFVTDSDLCTEFESIIYTIKDIDFQDRCNPFDVGVKDEKWLSTDDSIGYYFEVLAL